MIEYWIFCLFFLRADKHVNHLLRKARNISPIELWTGVSFAKMRLVVRKGFNIKLN